MILRSLFRILSCRHSSESVEVRNSEHCCTDNQAVVPQERPHPLPKTRHRLSETTLATHPQPFSSLCLRLPAEIRRQIYKLVFCGEMFHLGPSHQGMISGKLENPETIDGQGLVEILVVPIEFLHPMNGPSASKVPKNILALVQTCRIVYAESIPFLYSNITFSMTSLFVLIDLHDFALLPQSFKQIRHLNLYWGHEDSDYFRTSSRRRHQNYCPPNDLAVWQRFWEIVAGMELLSLSMWIDYIGPQENLALDKSWMQPMLEVKGVKYVGIRIQQILGMTYERPHLLERRLEEIWTSK